MKASFPQTLVALLATVGLFVGLTRAQSLSTNAERVLQYLEDQKGLKTLAGQEERPGQLTADQGFIQGVTGKRPAIRGWDIRGDNPSPVTEARNSWMNFNQLVQFSWHMGYPPNADSFDNAKLPSDPTIVSAAIDQMLTPGTSLNTSFRAKLDTVAALTANGRNAASTGYLLGADSFTFVGQ